MNYIFYTNEGQIKSTTSCQENLFQYQIIPDGCQTLQTESALVNIFNYYVDNGILVELPTKPDQYSIFDYSLKQWVQNEPLAKYEIRVQRDDLLAKSDWTDTSSAPDRLGQAVYQEWQTYRQALRDIPKQTGFPFNVVWPIAPN